MTNSKEFDKSLVHILESEGGFVNHPDDPGGATNLGITQKTLANYRGREVSEEEVANLTNKEAATIYKNEYWDSIKADQLPKGLALALFDFSVNSGPGTAARFLQRVVGADVDGKIGPQTLAAVKAMDEGEVIRSLMADRLAFLKGLKTWDTFGKGWSNRVARVERDAMKETSDA